MTDETRDPRTWCPQGDPRAPVEEVDVWVTSEGVEIPVTEMTDSHLVNALAWCKRHSDCIEDQVARAYEFASGCRGEMASYYADQMADRATDINAAFQRSYRALKKEYKRREGCHRYRPRPHTRDH